MLIRRTQLWFRHEDCASCYHRALCLSVSEFARMAANKRAGRVGIWACSRSCTAIWMRVKQAEAHVFYAILKISCHQQARRSEVLGDNLSARYIHNNHKLTSFKQCDYYGLRSQNITKHFFELLQEVDGRISFYCCLYRYLWQFTTAGWQLIR